MRSYNVPPDETPEEKALRMLTEAGDRQRRRALAARFTDPRVRFTDPGASAARKATLDWLVRKASAAELAGKLPATDPTRLESSKLPGLDPRRLDSNKIGGYSPAGSDLSKIAGTDTRGAAIGALKIVTDGNVEANRVPRQALVDAMERAAKPTAGPGTTLVDAVAATEPVAPVRPRVRVRRQRPFDVNTDPAPVRIFTNFAADMVGLQRQLIARQDQEVEHRRETIEIQRLMYQVLVASEQVERAALERADAALARAEAAEAREVANAEAAAAREIATAEANAAAQRSMKKWTVASVVFGGVGTITAIVTVLSGG